MNNQKPEKTSVNLYLVTGGIVAATTAILLVRKLFFGQRMATKCYPPGTVVLHQVGRGPLAPSLSPFPLKLETYLRMAKIPYENVHGRQMSSKGKTPFIRYNGKEYADSQLIVDFLNGEKGIDLNSHLSREQKAISRAFLKMTEENLYWTLALERFVYGSTEYLVWLFNSKFIRWFLWLIKRTVKKQTWGQGIGRHSQAEVYCIMEKDMRALSLFLGEKKFFFGDQPSEVDCAIFGMLAQCVWHMKDSPHEKLATGELQNLERYCNTMKETFWPDWDECITHSHTKEATK